MSQQPEQISRDQLEEKLQGLLQQLKADPTNEKIQAQAQEILTVFELRKRFGFPNPPRIFHGKTSPF